MFANVVLADEINRTPPKTQSALLGCMQERSVTSAGEKYILDAPFFVLATQNPIEQEGTYPLPEAQLDRFMFNVVLDYPNYDEELMIVKMTSSINKVNLDNKYITASAVIAGVVLETSLRTLCDQESIDHGKLDKMNADLAKKGIYNKLQQKQITALADVRNSAAHGKTEEFTRDDVSDMITKIETFLITHLSE